MEFEVDMSYFVEHDFLPDTVVLIDENDEYPDVIYKIVNTGDKHDA